MMWESEMPQQLCLVVYMAQPDCEESQTLTSDHTLLTAATECSKEEIKSVAKVFVADLLKRYRFVVPSYIHSYTVDSIRIPI